MIWHYLKVKRLSLSLWGFPSDSGGKQSAHNAGNLGSNLGWEDLLEKRKAIHFSILAWRTPWTVCGPQGHKQLDTTERISRQKLSSF